MIEFILGAFIVAWKKGYKLKPIFSSWQIYIPILFMLFYIFLEITIWIRWFYFVPYQQIIKTSILLGYVPLCLKYRLYESDRTKSSWGILTSPMLFATLCLWLGSTFNKLAMNANNGYMPFFPSNSYATGYYTDAMTNDGIHVLGNAQSALIPLTDTIDLGWSIMSIGDVLVRIYVFTIIYYSIKNTNKFIK